MTGRRGSSSRSGLVVPVKETVGGPLRRHCRGTGRSPARNMASRGPDMMEAMLKALALGDRGLGSSIGLGGKPCPSLYHYATVKHIHVTCLLHCPHYLACCTVPRYRACCTVHVTCLLHCPRYLLAAMSTLLHCPHYLLAAMFTLTCLLHCPLVALSTLSGLVPCPHYLAWCIVHTTLLGALSTLPCLLHCPRYLLVALSTCCTVHATSLLSCPRYLLVALSTLPPCCNVHATSLLHCPRYLAWCTAHTTLLVALSTLSWFSAATVHATCLLQSVTEVPSCHQRMKTR